MGRNDPDNKDENEEQSWWLLKWKYKQLFVIPAIFRLPETRVFIEKWQDSFGLWPQPPEIRGCGRHCRITHISFRNGEIV